MARAITFTVLLLSNLGLIYVNRSWTHQAWRGAVTSNRSFHWIALATVSLLALVLGIPQARTLFAFAMPPFVMLALAACVSLLSLLWFEAMKRVGRST